MHACHDNERVMDTIKARSWINLENVNTKMMYFHDFRPNNREKWMSDKDFLAWERNRGQSWDKIPNYTKMPYKNGFDENILVRPRDKEKEVSNSIFSSVIPADVWKDRVFKDESLRLHKHLEVIISEIIS